MNYLHSAVARMRVVLAVCLALVAVSVASAQPVWSTPEQKEQLFPKGNESLTTQPGTTTLPGTTECFDYYHFGSVDAAVVPSVQQVTSGTSITFTGTLANKNTYPLVDGALYVKVFKKHGDTSKNPNGPDLVDQFLVQGGIVIPASGTVPIQFAWQVPSYLESGDYFVATFFTVSRKFNLLGLSFTDDVVGNTAAFSVVGEQKGAVRFTKNAVTVNAQPYFFAAFPPRVDAGPVTISAPITNTTDTDARGVVSWTVYQWDAQLRENALQEETASVTIPAHKTIRVPIVVKNAAYPVYLVVGTLRVHDTQSIIGVRFVRSGVDRLRINFPSVLAYPLTKGVKNTLFSCLHNSGDSVAVQNGRLELTLSDAQGAVIHSYTYKGPVTGAMMGVADTFVPTRDYTSFTLDARLYAGDTFVDEAHLEYVCSELGTQCLAQDPNALQETAQPGAEGGALDGMLAVKLYGLGAVAVLVVVALLYALYARLRG